MDDTVVRGLLQVVGISLVPVLVVVLAGRAGRVLDHLVTRRAARSRVHTGGRPLEDLAADLRRLHPAVHHPPPGTTRAVHQGTTLAYDDRLAQAAQALGEPTPLTGLGVGGFDREVERVRLELRLVDLGLQLRTGPLSDGGTPGR